MQIVIYGSGETAVLAYEYFTYDSNCEVVAFAVDSGFLKGEQLLGLPVVPFEDLHILYPPSKYSLFVAAGSGKLNRVRYAMYEKAKQKGYKCASYVSSKANIWPNVQIGENCFILEGNNLQPFVRVGVNTTLWSGNHIGHRTVIGSHCFIASHVVISGFCSLGDFSFVGVNASIADNVCVATDNLISFASSITKSTSPNSIYIGNPARKRTITAKQFYQLS